MIELTIPDMTCGHCASKVTKAITQSDSQARIHIDLPAKKVRVETTQSREDIVEALSDAGYMPC